MKQVINSIKVLDKQIIHIRKRMNSTIKTEEPWNIHGTKTYIDIICKNRMKLKRSKTRE